MEFIVLHFEQFVTFQQIFDKWNCIQKLAQVLLLPKYDWSIIIMFNSMFNDYILVLSLFLGWIKVSFLTLTSLQAVEPYFNASLGNNFTLFSVSFTDNNNILLCFYVFYSILKRDILYVEPVSYFFMFYYWWNSLDT